MKVGNMDSCSSQNKSKSKFYKINFQNLCSKTKVATVFQSKMNNVKFVALAVLLATVCVSAEPRARPHKFGFGYPAVAVAQPVAVPIAVSVPRIVPIAPAIVPVPAPIVPVPIAPIAPIYPVYGRIG